MQDNLQAEPTVTAARIRNRRYRKLKELHAKGLFTEQAIKLRHPGLYFAYVGQHVARNGVAASSVNMPLSELLTNNLMNMQYKRLLAEEGKQAQVMDVEDGQQQIVSVLDQLTQMSDKGQQGVTEQQLALHQQNLIDHAEQLFLEGKWSSEFIDYNQVDYNEDLDDLEQQAQDLQEKYFAEEPEEEDDPAGNTGIQDY